MMSSTVFPKQPRARAYPIHVKVKVKVTSTTLLLHRSEFSYTTTGTISSPLTKGIPRIPDDISVILLDIYRIRVDSVYKILHVPSTIAQIRLLHDSTGSTSNSSSSLQALEFAIYYMSLCTITDVESQERLKFSNRKDLLHQCRTSTEYFLQKANLLRDPSMKSLQAFVIYIVS